jgi:cytidylate kinase
VVHPVDLITISREFGAGGGELAAALGAALGWRVIDEELVDLVARRLGVAPADVVARDEHAPRLLERIGGAFLRTSPDMAVAPEVLQVPTPGDISAATRAGFVEAASTPPVIMVGHGTQALFQARSGALHLRLVAPLQDRLRRIRVRTGCTEGEAMTLARRMDEERDFYVRHYYQRDWRDPLLYHLQINTGGLSVTETVRIVREVIVSRAVRGIPDVAETQA